MFANGKYAWGLCDVCSQRFLLSELSPIIIMARPTNLLACSECNDQDHPQLFLGMVAGNDPDPIALRNPRPDTALDASRAMWGWNPVGNPAVFTTAQVGTVTVETNG